MKTRDYTVLASPSNCVDFGRYWPTRRSVDFSNAPIDTDQPHLPVLPTQSYNQRTNTRILQTDDCLSQGMNSKPLQHKGHNLWFDISEML